MLMRALLVHIAHETSGAARIRHSLRPLNSRGRENYLQSSGKLCRENVEVWPMPDAVVDSAADCPPSIAGQSEAPSDRSAQFFRTIRPTTLPARSSSIHFWTSAIRSSLLGV